ncbi:MAG: C25 family cysteine peptidase, partial [Bacteroidota bacterium]
NWFVSFDSVDTFLPSMLAGRLPVENPVQAERVVDKLIGYDSYRLDDWNKNFLFITGGISPSEQASFNGLTELIIGEHVDPAPVGGTSFRVYKETPDAIDGENTQLMRDIFRDGLVFVNFLGHSGGRVWGVDIGDPNTLENTDGALPFISSVSCNVGGFAEPSNNVLSEDFVLADNRGAIAMWASSSLGYANVGATLVEFFLDGVSADTARGLGALTTAARIRLWQARGSDFVTIASVKLNPLIGDPLSTLAIPDKPDLAITAEDISSNASTVASEDTSLAVRLRIHNYGLVPSDSVSVRLTDTYGGSARTILDNANIPPVLHVDSVTVSWDALDEKGLHTLTAALDPGNLIQEVSEANNSTTRDEYIFTAGVLVVRPFDNSILPPVRHRLLVVAPGVGDSAVSHVEFELDTVDTFDSPFVSRSGQVSPGAVSAEWETPQVETGKLYFWRVRSVRGATVSNWTVSSFSVDDDAPAAPQVRWKQFDQKQFARQMLTQTSATDSGVTISQGVAVHILARSLGYRANPDKDYYSILQIDDQTMYGLWWVRGSSFIVARVSSFTGERDFQWFTVSSQPSQADEMARYINLTEDGDYLAISVIFDGATNVNDTLRSALKGLGSTMIDSLSPGHSWMLIARKGFVGAGTPTREQWSPDGVAIDSVL